MGTLEIVFNQGEDGNVTHNFSAIGELEESKCYITIFNGFLQIKEYNGGLIEAVFWSDITIIDNRAGLGTVYNPISITQLQNLLIQFKHPAYYERISNIGSLISTDGGNAIIVGSDGLLYAPVGGGGGGTIGIEVATGVSGSSQIVAIPTGKIAKLIQINRTNVYQSEFAQVGVNVTITWEFFGDEVIEIFYQ